MEKISSIRPFVRVAHHYQFPIERNANEVNRIGYCYAFHLVTEGKGTVSANGHQSPVKKGDLIYFPPMVKHAFYSNPNQSLASYNLYCDLWMSHPLVTNHHLIWNEADFNQDLVTLVVPCTELDELPVVIPLQHQNALISIFQHAVGKQGTQESYTDLIKSSLIKAFLMELVQTVETNRPIDYRITPIIERMDKEANASHNYETWLAECGLQKSHFHMLFKQATGISPKAYWTKAIMRQAEAELWESNRSVTRIAEDLGYSSIHHFTKQFTQYHGVSPSEYRKRAH